MNRAVINSVAFAMFDLRREVTKEGRIRNTTQGIYDRLTTPVSSGSGYVVGQLEADDYWIYVGNGRGPGGMPPVNNIANWMRRARIEGSPYAIAKSIAQRGTRDYREKRTNVFMAAADKWENGPSLLAVQETSGKDLEDRAVEIVRLNMKANG